MSRIVILVLAGQVALLVGGAAVASADVDADAMVGNWAVNGSCGDESIEHLEFRKDGSFQQMRGGTVEAMGFWTLNDEVVDLSLISSPAFFDEQLKGMTGKYFYFPVRVVPFNQQANSFEAVGLLGKEVLRALFERCP